MEISGEAIIASLEVIRGLYENINSYRNLKYINKRYLSEICLLVGIKDHLHPQKFKMPDLKIRHFKFCGFLNR